MQTQLSHTHIVKALFTVIGYYNKVFGSGTKLVVSGKLYVVSCRYIVRTISYRSLEWSYRLVFYYLRGHSAHLQPQSTPSLVQDIPPQLAIPTFIPVVFVMW